jgi:hypothetical protein
VAKTEQGSNEVHHDDYCSDTEHVVEEGGDNEVMPNVAGGEATIIQGNLQELIRNKKKAAINLEEDEDEDEDDTLLQYCSDGGDANNDVMSTDDEDNDI